MYWGLWTTVQGITIGKWTLPIRGDSLPLPPDSCLICFTWDQLSLHAFLWPTPLVPACPHLSSPTLTCPHLSYLPSPTLTCPHLHSPVLTYPHLHSPVLTCTHLSSPALTCPTCLGLTNCPHLLRCRPTPSALTHPSLHSLAFRGPHQAQPFGGLLGRTEFKWPVFIALTLIRHARQGHGTDWELPRGLCPGS